MSTKDRSAPSHYETSPITPVSFQERVARRATAPTCTRDTLSDDQKEIYDHVIEWTKGVRVGRVLGGERGTKAPFLTVGGLAGTGKTHLIAALTAELQEDYRIAFCAFTGKAANVLTRKLADAGLHNTQCNTIHSLIKIPVSDKEGRVVGWTPVPFEDFAFDLIVVDEASMIASDLWEDLQAYGLPILAVGDHGQLPPVGSSSINLMANPDYRLERIHRQAEDNPIIALAQWVRAGRDIAKFRTSDSRIRFVRFPDVADTVGVDHSVICFKNETRNRVNAFVRKKRGYETDIPLPHELVILLKNARPIYNGMRGMVEYADPEEVSEFGTFFARIAFADDNLRVMGQVSKYQFGREKTFAAFTEFPKPHPHSWGAAGLLFDYGYAMTCHKHQGSQSKECTVFVDKWLGKTADDRIRWLYTAVSRASERLNLIIS